jgi:hypothetical protein
MRDRPPFPDPGAGMMAVGFPEDDPRQTDCAGMVSMNFLRPQNRRDQFLV